MTHKRQQATSSNPAQKVGRIAAHLCSPRCLLISGFDGTYGSKWADGRLAWPSPDRKPQSSRNTVPNFHGRRTYEDKSLVIGRVIRP